MVPDREKDPGRDRNLLCVIDDKFDEGKGFKDCRLHSITNDKTANMLMCNSVADPDPGSGAF
jgi:hypothetical protein